jgi:glycosyltransferase involved in cell wall biosynthesis
MTDVAVAHSSLYVHGGSEHVAFELARTFDAPLFVPRADDDLVPGDVEVVELLGKRAGAAVGRLPTLPSRIARLPTWQTASELHEFDVVIIAKAGPMWYIPPEDQATIAYVHSPPRNLYDRFAKTSSTDSVRGWLDAASSAAFKALFNANRVDPDVWVCNSELVQRRLESYWNVSPTESRVVYPPVNTASFNPDAAPTRDYYLTLGRLHEHKRVDDIIHEFNRLGSDYPLVVAGDGPERDHLEAIADGHIEFRGFVDEDAKRRLYAGAKAFIMAAENEDFGMTPCEAMASGTPVLGVEDGFTEYQVVPRRTGYTFDRVPGNLAGTVRIFESRGIEWTADEIAVFAATHWDVSQFREQMRQAVNDAQERAQITPWSASGRGELTATALPDGGDER